MNHKIRDSAFTMLFGIKENVVDLYEFLTGKRLDPATIEAVKLQDGFEKVRFYNDVAFLTSDHELLVLIEHQSTPNPNMAFRILEYYTRLAGQYIKITGANKYGVAEVHIPKAQFFVVYNGKGQMDQLPILDLGDVQVKATVQNIHYEELQNKNKDNSLAGYAKLINLVIEQKMPVDDAIDVLINEGYLTKFLNDEERKRMFAEVFSYDNELISTGIMQGIKQGVEQGVKQGVKQGAQQEKIKIARTSLSNGIDVETVALITNLNIDVVLEIQASISD